MATEPRLKHDDANRQKMDQSPPELVCPGPTAPVSDKHCRQPEDDKDDDREVQKKDGICESLMWHGGCAGDA